jgi:signal transduction histidine kinase
MEKIRVVAVDDHPLIRHALAKQLEEQEDMTLLAEGCSGDDVLTLVEQYRPDVLLLDLDMPKSKKGEKKQRFQAFPVIGKIRDQYPATAIILLTQHLNPILVQGAIERGVSGYLLKDDDLSLNVPEAIRAIHKGGLHRLRSSHDGIGQTAVLTQHPWAELVFFLCVGEHPVALLLLGPPVPNGHFNFQQVAFVRQVGQVIAVTAETIRLSDSSREMLRQLMQVRDVERTRLARHIHDDPIQPLSLVVNDLSCLQSRLGRLQPELGAELPAGKECLQQVGAQLRDICGDLRSPLLDQGIQWAIAEGLAQFAADTQLKVVSTIEVNDDVPVPDVLATAMQQICAEALHNVRRHAQATAVHVSLTCQDGHLVLAVADDGRGMPRQTGSIPSLVRARHFGIAGMHERAGLVGGELVIGKSPAGGAMVTAKVPLRQRLC